MFIYDKPDAPNIHKWDFIDPIDFICSHHKQHGKNKFECLGHPDGDKLYPAFHGDPYREHKFWLYPRHLDLVDPRWDHYTVPCNHCE